jgi:hypothetical protein
MLSEKYSPGDAVFGRVCIILVQNGSINHFKERKKTAHKVLEN